MRVRLLVLAALAVLAALVAGCEPTPPADRGPAPQAPAPGEPSTPAPDATGAPEPTGFPDIRFSRFLTGLDQPLYVTSAKDGSGALYVVEKGGRILTATDGRVASEPFLDISGKVSTGSEQGLLGLAFPPDFERKRRFYVDYTDRSGDTVLARYELAEDGRADPGSEQVLLRIDQPFPNHNGGMIEFGPDGFLYVAIGDGGLAGDPFGNARDVSSLLGKILRLRVEADGEPPGRAEPAPGNPFRDGEARFVWHYGLRNPWRFSFDRENGRMFIGDVGQSAYEEIDAAPARRGGLDFGWDRFEGRHTYPGGEEVDDFLGTVPPAAEYSRDLGNSVTGGYVYRGSRFPEMRGMYLYADYGSGNVWGLRNVDGRWRSRLLLRDAGSIASFGEDEDGELLAVDLEGSVYRVETR